VRGSSRPGSGRRRDHPRQTPTIRFRIEEHQIHADRSSRRSPEGADTRTSRMPPGFRMLWVGGPWFGTECTSVTPSLTAADLACDTLRGLLVGAMEEE